MLEDKRLIKVPKWTERVMKGSGTNGVEGFIDAVVNKGRKKRKDKVHLSFIKPKPPQTKIVLNKNQTYQKITEVKI